MKKAIIIYAVCFVCVLAVVLLCSYMYIHYPYLVYTIESIPVTGR